MYSITPHLIKIPKGVVAVRKLPSLCEPIRVAPAFLSKTLLLQREYSNDKKWQENNPLRRHSYKYIFYSLLFATTAYTSYKIW